MDRQNDYDATKELLDLNGINYHTSILYDNKNEICGTAIWLDVGHVEFNEFGMITNIVNY